MIRHFPAKEARQIPTVKRRRKIGKFQTICDLQNEFQDSDQRCGEAPNTSSADSTTSHYNAYYKHLLCRPSVVSSFVGQSQIHLLSLSPRLLLTVGRVLDPEYVFWALFHG